MIFFVLRGLRFLRINLVALMIAGALAAPLAIAAAAAAAAASTKKILFYSKSAGFEHSVIKRMNGQPSFAETILTELGVRHGLEFTFSKDGSLFTPEYLSQFDVIFFFTTGDLTTVGLDRNPPMSVEGKAALLRAIEGGKGFVGAHCATDTFHSPRNEEHSSARFQDDGDRADPFIKMIGGEFIRHGAQQRARLIPADGRFPGMQALPVDFTLHEEWYSLKNFAPDLHVLLVQETAGMKGDDYDRPSFPATWARRQGKGRVFYTSLGHREDVWTNPAFQELLAGGLAWAAGRVDAEIEPNLSRVAPEAGRLPVYKEPVKKPEPTKAPVTTAPTP